MKPKSKIQTYLIVIISFVIILSNNCEKDDNILLTDSSEKLTDVDGNVYKTITIGTQTWMAENLRTTKFNDNTVIPHVYESTAWSTLSSPGICTYKNTNNADTINTYGRLYNWYVVQTCKLAPTGWHVPTDDEWTTLENYLIANGYNYDGTTAGDRNSNNKIAKALAALSNWASSTTEGDVGNTDFPNKRNATGFTALPGGYRNHDGTFYRFGFSGYWWSSTEENTTEAWTRHLYYYYSFVFRNELNKSMGFSVRCVKD